MPRSALKNMIETVRAFLVCANNNVKPGKDTLFEAVTSLVKQGSRKLSRAWDKTQFSWVLLRWCQEALRLPNEHLQSELTIDILVSRKESKRLQHKLCLFDAESDSMETFQIESPSPILPPQGFSKRSRSSTSTSTGIASSASSASPALSAEGGTLGHSDGSFLEEIAMLGEDFELLAAIPAIHTPRVKAPGKNPPQLPDLDTEAFPLVAEPEGTDEGI